ncbi:MAG: hypothetical protein ACE5GA_01100, partial [Candidatus Zixiibacteriota bacterium]
MVTALLGSALAILVPAERVYPHPLVDSSGSGDFRPLVMPIPFRSSASGTPFVDIAEHNVTNILVTLKNN